MKQMCIETAIRQVWQACTIDPNLSHKGLYGVQVQN